MQVCKTIVQITVLHPLGESVAGKSLDQIYYETNEGAWLGMSEVTYSAPVADDAIESECKALGNDGDFFKLI